MMIFYLEKIYQNNWCICYRFTGISSFFFFGAVSSQFKSLTSFSEPFFLPLQVFIRVYVQYTKYDGLLIDIEYSLLLLLLLLFIK